MADPNNVLARKQRVIFFLPCKAAQSSIKRALESALGMPEGQMEFVSLAEARNLHGYFRVGIVRHPLSRLVSCWADKTQRSNLHHSFPRHGMKNGMTFGEFVERVSEIPDDRADQHFRGQTWDIGTRFDLLMRFELLQYHWQAAQVYLRKRMNLPGLGKHRVSEHDRWQTYYDADLARRVADRYADDMKNYGYSTCI